MDTESRGKTHFWNGLFNSQGKSGVRIQKVFDSMIQS